MLSLIRKTLRHLVAPRHETSTERRVAALGLSFGPVLSRKECEEKGLLPTREQAAELEHYKRIWLEEDSPAFRGHVGHNPWLGLKGQMIFRMQ
jgi:hypothetical protein